MRLGVRWTPKGIRSDQSNYRRGSPLIPLRNPKRNLSKVFNAKPPESGGSPAARWQERILEIGDPDSASNNSEQGASKDAGSATEETGDATSGEDETSTAQENDDDSEGRGDPRTPIPTAREFVAAAKRTTPDSRSRSPGATPGRQRDNSVNVVATQPCSMLMELTEAAVRKYWKDGGNVFNATGDFESFIDSDVQRKLDRAQKPALAKGFKEDITKYGPWRDLDPAEFYKLLLIIVDKGEPAQMAKLLHDKLFDPKRKEDMPLDPTRFETLVERTGSMINMVIQKSVDEEEQARTIAMLLRSMRDPKGINPTLIDMADDLKRTGEDKGSLEEFLDAVMARVGRQAELLRDVAKAKLTTLVAKGPTKRPREDERKFDEPDRKVKTKLKTQRGPSADEARATCNACGRGGHVWADCKIRLGGHPDTNKNASVKFADSEKGRAWKAHATYPMNKVPATFTLDGKKIDPKGELILTISNSRDTTHALTCGISHDTDKIREVGILVDTGCLTLNLISDTLAEQLRLDGAVLESGVRWKIRSLHGSEDCDKIVAMNLHIFNQISNNMEILPMTAVIVGKEVLPYDFVLGRPDIKKYKLLSGDKIPLEGNNLNLSNSIVRKDKSHIDRENANTDSSTEKRLAQSRLRHSFDLETAELPPTFVEPGPLAPTRESRKSLRKSGNPALQSKRCPESLSKIARLIVDDHPDSLINTNMAKSIVGWLTDHVRDQLQTTLENLEEGIKGGQMAQALQELETEGLYKIEPTSSWRRSLNDEGTISDEVVAPVHLLTLLGEVPDSWEIKRAATDMYTIEGKRVHVSDLIDSTDDHDEIDYTKEETPWEEPSDDQAFTFGEDAKPEELTLLTDLLDKYKKIFRSTLTEEAARIPPLEMQVDEKKWKIPSNRRAARLQSELKNKEIQVQVQKMIELHLIQPSQTAERSQVVLAKKPDGSWRFCIDYRALNDATESMGWPIPNIPEMLRRIGARRPKYFGVMDLTKGFFQAPLHENSRKYTTFATWLGNYEWLRVPMGIKGAPSWFQQMIGDVVLAGLLHNCCELYIDDVIIYGETFEEYMANLEKVLDRFLEHNIIVSPKKCKFLMSSVEYLGHRIDKEGISFSEEQKTPVLNFPVPETAGKLKQFLGVAVYFHSHVKDFSRLARPLHQRLGQYNKNAKHKRIRLEPREVEAFEELKRAIANCPVLYYPDPQAEVILETDASDYGIGAYLYQKNPDGGEDRPIAFISRALQGAQLNWSTPEKEAYAIFHALQKLEHLLRDAHFLLRTDHKNLTYINYGNSAKIMRWKMMIQEYDFDIEHVAGEKNIIADAFSRLVEAKGLDNETICLLIRARVQNQSKKDRGFRLSDAQYTLLKTQFHNEIVGHHGVDATVRMMKAKGYTPENFPQMRQAVMSFIHRCACCQKADQRKPKNLSHPFVIGSYNPMEKVSIDTIGPFEKDKFGNKYIVAMTDCFSRFTVLFPARNATAEEAARAILHWTGLFGKPQSLLTDMGTQYINKNIDALLVALKTHKLDMIAGVHQKNGIQERRNKECNRHLRAIMFHKNIKDSWSEVLPIVQRILNAQHVESLGTTPASIIFGNSVQLDSGLTLQIDEDTATTAEKKVLRLSEWVNKMSTLQKECIRVAQLTQAKTHDEYFDNFHDDEITTFPINSYVLVTYERLPTKMHLNWRGPFRVVAQDDEDPDRYTVQNLITNKLEDFPTAQMKLFVEDEREDILVAANADKHEDLVEKILSHTGKKEEPNKLTFEVKFIGASEPDVIRYADIKHNETLHEYLTNLGGSWQALIPEKYSWEGEHYNEMHPTIRKQRKRKVQEQKPTSTRSSKRLNRKA